MDYGRWALIVDEKTESLKKIPDITSAANVHRESREVTLAEYGMATFVETDDEMARTKLTIANTTAATASKSGKPAKAM